MNAPARLLILTHSYPRFVGDWRSNFIEYLARAYARNGLEVTVLVPRSNTWMRQEWEGSGVRIISYKYMPFQSWNILGYGRSVENDLNLRPLHILLFPFLLVAGVIHLSLILRRQRYCFIHAHWAVPNGAIALMARFLSRTRVKILTSCPGSDVRVLKRTGLIGKGLARLIARSDYLSCNSSDLKEDLVSLGVPPDKIDYVIYGVDDDLMGFDLDGRRRLRAQFEVADDTVLILMVGRLVPKKGFSTGIIAIQYLKARQANVHLLIIGNGQQEPILKRLVVDTGTGDMVTFVGEVPHAELQAYYSACDVFVMPTERLPSDGLNVVVVEAMACGRPVVASAVGGNDLVVFEAVNGYLHEPGNPEDLAEKLFLLSKDPKLRLELGVNARRLVEERFNWNAIAKYYIDRYQKIL